MEPIGPHRLGIIGMALAVTLVLARVVAGEGNRPGVTAGASLFLTYCASCHGTGGEGNGPVAGALRTPPPDLTRLVERYGTPLPRARLAGFIDGREYVAAHGPREMPVWGNVFFEDVGPSSPDPEASKRKTIAVLLDYLESIQRVQDAARPRRPSG